MSTAVNEVPSFLAYDRDGTELMRIESATINELLREAGERLDDLATESLERDIDARLGSSEKAEITKELLFIAHLCDKARTSVLDEYYRFKGETAHMIGGRRR